MHALHNAASMVFIGLKAIGAVCSDNLVWLEMIKGEEKCDLCSMEKADPQKSST